MKPRSPRWLASILRTELALLKKIATAPHDYYRQFDYRTASGKIRPIAEPDPVLKQIQKRIVVEILRPVPMPPCVHGSLPGHSPHTNAVAHHGQSVVVRIDIQNFFPSVTNRMIYGVWVEVFGYGRALASLLTKLTTLEGHLPQGTPTSSYLANLVLRRADAKIQAVADVHGLRYTRFVDDLVVSGARARDVITAVVKEIGSAGFTCNRKKLQVVGPRCQRLVTGYTVDRVSVAKNERDRVKASIRELKSGADKYNECDITRRVRSIQGRVTHVARTNPGAARRLQKQLADAVSSLTTSRR